MKTKEELVTDILDYEGRGRAPHWRPVFYARVSHRS